MLVTGRRSASAGRAATGLVSTPPPGSAAGLFTWRKAILGGGLAFGALAIVAVGYTVMRLLGIGSVGTLLAKGVIKDREPILLAEFENRRADSTLGPHGHRGVPGGPVAVGDVRVMDQQAVAQR